MHRFLIVSLLFVFVFSGCQQQAPEEAAVASEAPGAEPASAAEPAIDLEAVLAAAVNNPNRSAADKGRDEQRKPAQVMAFAGLQPGMTVLDLFAGGGWYTELLSYVVGDDGKVLSHNTRFFYDNYDDGTMAARIADARLANVVTHDREFGDLELEENSLDAIVAGMIYHDIQRMAEDPDDVFLQLCKALKPGGIMLITDHHAPEGTGNAMALESGGEHRIEEAFVVTQMEDAGFELVGSSDVLRVPEDDRSKAFFRMDGAFTDRFVLLFKKP